MIYIQNCIISTTFYFTKTRKDNYSILLFKNPYLWFCSHTYSSNITNNFNITKIKRPLFVRFSKIIDEVNYAAPTDRCAICCRLNTLRCIWISVCTRLPSARVIPRQGVSSSTESHSRRNLRHLYGERTARRFHPTWWMWRASWGRGWLLPRKQPFRGWWRIETPEESANRKFTEPNLPCHHI